MSRARRVVTALPATPVKIDKVDNERLQSYLDERGIVSGPADGTLERIAVYLRLVASESSVEQPVFCPTCNAPSREEICPLCGSSVGTAVVVSPEHELDEHVRKIKAGLASATAGYWRTGKEILAVFETRMYKRRIDPETGRPAYKSFEAFCKAEIGLNVAYARRMMAVAAAFGEEDIRRFGPTKLDLIARVPTAERQGVLDRVGDLPREDVRREVQRLFPAARRPAVAPPERATDAALKRRGSGAPSSSTPKASRLTVVLEPGETTVQMKLRASGKWTGVEPAVNGLEIKYSFNPAERTLTITRVRA